MERLRCWDYTAGKGKNEPSEDSFKIYIFSLNNAVIGHHIST